MIIPNRSTMVIMLGLLLPCVGCDADEAVHPVDDAPGGLRVGYTFFNIVNSGTHAVNAHQQYGGGNVNMWSLSLEDSEQRWYWWSVDNLRLEGTAFCLNAYQPHQDSNVNLYDCDANDADQQWDFEFLDDNLFMVRRIDTDFCLNAHDVADGSNLNLWTCDEDDPEQQFTAVYYLPAPGP